jgi:hypothetical protein
MGAESGFPIIDLRPAPTTVSLNGEALPPAEYTRVLPPGITDTNDAMKFRAILRKLSANSCNILEVSYDLPSGMATFTDNAARMMFSMIDVYGRAGVNLYRPSYWEQYGPTGMEYDQYEQIVNIKFIPKAGVALAEPAVFSNGTVSTITAAKDEWSIQFPPYFTTSSFYLHVADKAGFIVRSGTYPAAGEDEPKIPLTVYVPASSTINPDAAITTIQDVFAEMERDFGDYAHKDFVAYVVDTSANGMEYAGATMTGLAALSHETFHSWFARGVMPTDGNAGWIDEGLARWRDRGYPLSSWSTWPPYALGARSPYIRGTDILIVYTLGSEAFAELARVLSGDAVNFKTVLSGLYELKNKKTISTPELYDFMRAAAQGDPDKESGVDTVFHCSIFQPTHCPTPTPTPAQAAVSAMAIEIEDVNQTKVTKQKAIKPVDHLPFTAKEVKKLQ